MRKLFLFILFLGLIFLPFSVMAATFTFTADADWDLGVYASTNSGPPGADDQIQIDPNVLTQFNHIWVALSGRDSVARIDTNVDPTAIGNGDSVLTAAEAGGTAVLGEYLSHPTGMAGNPSRTTVDLNGDVWVGNRNESSGGLGSITKISATPTGTTSTGTWNNTTFDRLSWSNAGSADTNGGTSTAADTAILNYVRTTGANVRHVSVDKDNNVWAGGGPIGANDQVFQLYNGSTGAPVPDPDGVGPKVTSFVDNNTGGYGGLVDGNGVVWSAGLSYNSLTRMDPATGARSTIVTGKQSYGLGIDNNGHIWNATWTNNSVVEIASDGTVLNEYALGAHGTALRGVAVTPDNDIWIAASGSSKVIRMNNDGTGITTINVGSTPTGVAVDSNGKVWVTNYSSNSVMRIDPTTNSVDLTIDLGPNATPYNYSDMTGTVVTGTTNPTGAWRYVADGGTDGQAWDKIFWNTEAEGDIPVGTSITILARVADTLAGLNTASFNSFLSGADLGLVGRYMEVKAVLTRSSNDPQAASPILSDLRFTTLEQSVPEPATLLLLGTGFFGLAALRRKRKK